MTLTGVRTRIVAGRDVTAVGLGGEGVLRTHGRDNEALAVIQEARAQGITYLDSARAYDGSEGYYGLFWKDHGPERERVFQTSKSARRDRKGALADLSRTLAGMRIPYLDLWQIHDVRTRDDIRAIEGPGGALEAFLEAKDQGLVRAIGVTGHHDPAILTHAVESWPVDTVLMPVNPVEGVIGGFLDSTLPAARKRGMGVIGMKILGAGQYIFPDAGITPEHLQRYALSWGIDVALVGCSTPEEVRQLAAVGNDPERYAVDERDQLHELFRPYAEQLAYYRGVIGGF